MRPALALGLLLAFCTSAGAARLHNARAERAIVLPRQTLEPHFARPRQSPNPKDPPVLMDQTPDYDDPSKFGGG